MTKVTLHYDLLRPLSDDDYANLSRAHSTYGMVRLMAPSADRIDVDYDASRLSKADVESVLARHGIPIRTHAQSVA